MIARTIALGLLLLATPAPAQENANGNRFGLSLALVSPQGSGSDGFGTGYQAGLLVHFNRESAFMGRLRVDYTVVDSKHPVQVGTIWTYPSPAPVPLMADVRREGYGVSYELMPHFGGSSREGAYAVLGLGGLLWNERRDEKNYPYGYWGAHTHSEMSFTPILGAGYRFNPHLSVEARLVGSFLSVGPNLLDEKERKDNGERHHLTVGTTFRF